MDNNTDNSTFFNKENITLIASTLIVGTGISIFANCTFLSEIKDPLIKTLFLTITFSSSSLGNFLLSKILIDNKIKWYWALPYGAIGGTLIGGLCGVIIIESTMFIGTSTGEIVFNEPITTGELFINALLMGSVLGGISGLVIGLIESPAISLILGH